MSNQGANQSGNQTTNCLMTQAIAMTNGHFGCSCYHPLFCFNQFGDLERAVVRPGNVASADNWRAVLEREIAAFLTRPIGRPPRRPIVFHHDFVYRASTWKTARRVVCKIEWHKGELFPRVGFLVTNLWRSAPRVVQFYNERGTAEQWIKEGKQALKWTRLSCQNFAANQVRLQLFALAYNLGNSCGGWRCRNELRTGRCRVTYSPRSWPGSSGCGPGHRWRSDESRPIHAEQRESDGRERNRSAHATPEHGKTRPGRASCCPGWWSGTVPGFVLAGRGRESVQSWSDERRRCSRKGHLGNVE